jgi:hypothetical protein
MSQLVELLGISQAAAWPPSTDEVVSAVRPQPDNSRPHNIALRKAQAVRLLRDLESLLKVPVVVLAACLASAGCSARVEVERTNDTDATATEATTADSHRTTVAVDFQPRSPPPVPQPEPPPVTVTVTPEPRPTTVTNHIVVINHRAGDMTYNSEFHLHVSGPPRQPVEEAATIRREVQLEPRPIDPRCEQLRKEHEERVRTWKAFPLGE